jgi:mono/diheme cytochrome c family protein
LKKRIFMPVLASVLALGLHAPAALAADSILEAQCASCHALNAPEKTDIDRLWQRQGPDLHYAGSKFNRPWLEQWLQDPKPIRPAGVLYTRHIKGSDKEDVIDGATLKPHPKLSAADAVVAAEALMALKAPAELIAADGFKGGKVSATMGAMFFNKLRGCSACHQSAPDVGGRSGPELYSAAARLQPDYIYSYMKHPQKIDPLVWMPDLSLSEPDAQRLTGYILTLGEAGSQP